MIVVKAGYDGVLEERVVRGRKRHLVEMRVDFGELEALEPDERRLLALPSWFVESPRFDVLRSVLGLLARQTLTNSPACCRPSGM